MSKYGNKPVKADGHRFDSQAEYRRYCELLLLQKAGEITELRVHPKYEIHPAFKHDGKRYSAIRYEGDFEYTEDGKTVVEDVKGVETAVFKLKQKMLLCRYPDIDFRIIKVRR